MAKKTDTTTKFSQEELDGLIFNIGAKSFFQTNSEQAKTLYRRTKALANIKKTDVVYDLYTGTGTIAQYLAKNAKKVIGIRIFDDQNGQMNFSSQDVDGEFLVVSQFTLYGNVDSGRRPGWSEAARPEQAEPLINYFTDCLKASGLKVETGIFQEDMNVKLTNHGPATLMIEVN